MIDRAKLQYCYELAFHPPRLNEVWWRMKAGEIADLDALGEMLDTALLLHQALPSEGYASQRALTRLALYQAKARAFGTVRFLENLRRTHGESLLVGNCLMQCRLVLGFRFQNRQPGHGSPRRGQE